MSRVIFKTRTAGEIKIHTILWTVSDVMDLIGNEVERLCTAITMDSTAELGKRFQLQMQFWAESRQDLIQIEFRSPIRIFILECHLVIDSLDKNPESKPIVSKEYVMLQANEWEHLITLSEKHRDELLSSDGSLCLKFEFKVINNIKVDKFNVPVATEYYSYIPEVQYNKEYVNFENFLNNGMFSDAIIKSVEQIEYKVHKVVLASRSPVLRAHFENNTGDFLIDLIDSPFESEVLKEVLNFIYSYKVPRIDEIPEKLLAAAEFYEIKRLKNLCERELYKKLNIENAIEILMLADLHSANTLKHLILEYIRDGKSKLVIKTEGWAGLKSIDLLKKISEHCIKADVDDKVNNEGDVSCY